MDSSSCDVKCIFYVVANVIVFILGVAGNGLVIWIAGFKVKKSVITTWYLSLAVSDFIFCCFLPFVVIYMAIRNWIFGLFMCKFTSFIFSLNMFSSIFLLVIISVDRCVVVMFPVWAQNQRTVRRASVIVTVAWIISAALSTPSAITKELFHKTETEREYRCVHNTWKSYTADTASQFVFSFVIPFLIIFICYVAITRKLKSNQMPTFKKPVKIMTVLIVTFLICWLPYHTVTMSAFFTDRRSDTAYVLGLILANVNSCLNPFLYAFMGKDIKKHCCALWSKVENAVQEEDFLMPVVANTTQMEAI
ncbi:hypothetical protein NFI96_006881 [Prochilodus magdalenae]|nr:hypothetical protein NFI96_006881 [Prochilodus magdalenae]